MEEKKKKKLDEKTKKDVAQKKVKMKTIAHAHTRSLMKLFNPSYWTAFNSSSVDLKSVDLADCVDIGSKPSVSKQEYSVQCRQKKNE